jgi:hypothetical protein
MKQILDLRPIYHRREERIRAHDILCWLAPPTHPHHRDGQGVADATRSTNADWSIAGTFCQVSTELRELRHRRDHLARVRRR